MLPILRLIPVGGVILAIVILVLALTPPSGVRAPLSPDMAPARGALIASADHPEWRQIFVNAALRRADELNQLRQLPDTPVRTGDEATTAEPKPPQKVEELAGVPTGQHDTDQEDVTGTVEQSPDAVIPVEIGEASSAELPLTEQEERPPVIRVPQRTRPPHESDNTAPALPTPATETRAETKAEQEAAKRTVEAKQEEPKQEKTAVEAKKAKPEIEKPAAEATTAEPAPEKPTVAAKRGEPDAAKPAMETKRVAPESEKQIVEAKKTEPSQEKPTLAVKKAASEPASRRTRRVYRRTRHTRSAVQTTQPRQITILEFLFASFQPQSAKRRQR